jgi:hypothetical protein
MAETLAEIHSLPIAGLPTLPMRGDPLPEIFDYLPQDAEFDALRQGLSRMENTAYEGSGALLHAISFGKGRILLESWTGKTLLVAIPCRTWHAPRWN